MEKIKIQIKNIFGIVLYEYEKENNTIRDTLEEAVKNKANLEGAHLYRANLEGTHLEGANLKNACLYRANLEGANLKSANLEGAHLESANFKGADFEGADFEGAHLEEANIYRAYLKGANSIPYIPLACPSDGAFIGWKKVRGRLVKLEIPEDAKRSSATTRKCRCDKAKVLAITDVNGNNPIDEIRNDNYAPSVTYKVGEMVFPDSFDENRWNECSHGIHFFINKQDAIDY